MNELDYTYTCNCCLCPYAICLPCLLWKPSLQLLLPGCKSEMHQGQVRDQDLFLLVQSLGHSQPSEMHSLVSSKPAGAQS